LSPRRLARAAAVAVLAMLSLAGLCLAAPAPASRAAALPPGVVSLTIVTVPHLPTAKFEFDGRPVASDFKGVVRLNVPRSKARHTLTLVTPSLKYRGTEAHFVRWWGQPNHDQGRRTNLTGLVMDQSRRIQVAFRVSYLVHYRFVDQNHLPVKSDRISRVVIRSDTGTFITSHSSTVRLTGYRPTLEGGTLAERQAVFSLWSVIMDGSNAVHQGQQRFIPSRPAGRQVTLEVALKSIHITANDRLFNQPVGSGVLLVYPDHKRKFIPFGGGHQITVNGLVRGNYEVHLVSAHAVGTARELTLSRNQFVTMRVWSYTDFGVVFLIIAVIVVASILGGRLGHADDNRKPSRQQQP